jgi:hypothetical protein
MPRRKALWGNPQLGRRRREDLAWVTRPLSGSMARIAKGICQLVKSSDCACSALRVYRNLRNC